MSDNGRDPIEKWLSNLRPNTQKSFRHQFDKWFEWLRKKPGFENVAPRDLIERLANPAGPERDEMLDLLQEYVSGLNLAKNSLNQTYTAIRSFFKSNRRELARDGFKIRGKRPPAPSHLTIQIVKRVVDAATLRDRSMLLVKWQSLLDTAGLSYANENLGEYLATEVRAGHDPIVIEIPGRKALLNEKPFYTFIGSDAVRALAEYFEKERGWPSKGEPVWKDKLGKAVSYGTIGDNYRSLLRRLGVIPEQKTGHAASERYGFGIHEFRDVARTFLHTRGKQQGLDGQVVEFFMGHADSLDKNNYDKFYEDREYTAAQYKIAEPLLNIVSNPSVVNGNGGARIEEIDKRMRDLEAAFGAAGGLVHSSIGVVEEDKGRKLREKDEEMSALRAEVEELKRLILKPKTGE